jgi:hypothetical protein
MKDSVELFKHHHINHVHKLYRALDPDSNSSEYERKAIKAHLEAMRMR